MDINKRSYEALNDHTRLDLFLEYVFPQASIYKKPSEKDIFDIFKAQKIKEFLESNKKSLFVCAGPGGGKTLFMKFIENRQWQRNQKKDE